MIQLIFVRHGQTDSSRNGTYCGWTDVELNKEGTKQAYNVQKKLEGMKVGKIFSSPLKRTSQTVKIINENFSLPVNYDERLKERNFGVWDDMSYEDICLNYPDELKLWEGDWINYCMDKGESALQVHHRTSLFVDEIIQDKSSRKVLIVTHLGCIRSMLAHLFGMGLEGSWRFRVDSGSISQVSVNDEGYAYLKGLNI